ncbi:hypothetical protein THOM_0962 [Trachipleistophora hominis]|uniref:Uncharacterized protein n=1 Tax=Trachipleistophora hominis TaxID=72359 RepID=L7JZ60_TRAHO|nr:hypothetical protein THOM_0962 [Trachipleistophora hominis]
MIRMRDIALVSGGVVRNVCVKRLWIIFFDGVGYFFYFVRVYFTLGIGLEG